MKKYKRNLVEIPVQPRSNADYFDNLWKNFLQEMLMTLARGLPGIIKFALVTQSPVLFQIGDFLKTLRVH